MGLALGSAGWRPVLSINATSSTREVVDMSPCDRHVLAWYVPIDGADTTLDHLLALARNAGADPLVLSRLSPALCARKNAATVRTIEEIRELIYGRRGKRKHKHRIIFTIRHDTVYVLYVRHTARDELEP